MARCKGCGAEIIWVKTCKGKSMPCDPDPRLYRQERSGKERVVTQNGEILACRIDTPLEGSTGYGYIPHWSTCPAQRKFKK